MATAEELLAQHAAQGLKVRGLKEAHGAKHPEVAAALTDLMAIKAAYKELTGEDVPGGGKSKKDKKKGGGAKPAIAAAAAPAKKKGKGGQAAAVANPKSKAKNPAKSSSAVDPAQLSRLSAIEADAEAVRASVAELRSRLGDAVRRAGLDVKPILTSNLEILKPRGGGRAAAAGGASAGGMYAAPLYTASDKVVVPKTMYSVPSYYGAQATPVLPKSCTSTYNPPKPGCANESPEVAALTSRYDKILADLHRLTQVADAEIIKRGGMIPTSGGDDMSDVLTGLSELIQDADAEILKRGGTMPSGAGAAAGPMVGKHGEILDPTKARPTTAVTEVSLFANPASFAKTPLLLVEHVRKQGKTVDVRQYWHGCNGMVGSTPSAKVIEAQRARPRINCDLRINLIWKNVPRTKMVVSPSHHVPIEGDATVAKYLCRVLCPDLYSTDVIRATEIDTLLDLADSLVGASSRNQKPALKQANQKLGKATYLGGDNMSIADLHLWSCIELAGAACDKNLKKWKATIEASELEPNLE